MDASPNITPSVETKPLFNKLEAIAIAVRRSLTMRQVRALHYAPPHDQPPRVMPPYLRRAAQSLAGLMCLHVTTDGDVVRAKRTDVGEGVTKAPEQFVKGAKRAPARGPQNPRTHRRGKPIAPAA